MVATPIGNLEDISRRALSVLSEVAIIAAEDTRRTRSLLAAFGIPAPELQALHDHNEAQISERIVTALRGGRDVALVSDAGTPLVADPGFTLIRACEAGAIKVVPIPGASALICALSVCPLATADFCFLGFLPSKRAARKSRLEAHIDRGPCVLFEAPHRIADCLMDISTLAPGRRVFVAREMTKKFETYLCGLPEQLVAELEGAGQLRGEFVVIIEAAEGNEPQMNSLSVRKTMRILSAELPPAQAARIGAELLGIPRRQLYELARTDVSSDESGK